MFQKILVQGFATAVTWGHHDHLLVASCTSAFDQVTELENGVICFAICGQVWQQRAAVFRHQGILGCRQIHACRIVETAEEFSGVQVNFRRPKNGALNVFRQKIETALRVCPKCLQGLIDVAMLNEDQLFLGQIVNKAGCSFKKQGQVILNARAGHACAHVAVNGNFGRVTFETFPPFAAKLRPALFIHGVFAAW